MQVREKVTKLRNTVFFEWVVAPEGLKVGSLKRRVRSHVVRWEMKSCTPLWREAHVQVKMHKAHQRWNTFGSCDVEKVYAVVARSTFGSQKCAKLPGSEHFWKLRYRISARRCGVKHISKSKCTKRVSLGALLEVEMFKKCTPLWREAHFQVKMLKTQHARTTFEDSDLVSFAWQAQGILHLAESGQNVRVMWHFQKRMAGVGHLKRIWKDALRVAGAALYAGGVGKKEKRTGTSPSALHSTFHFWRKSRRIASFSNLQKDR